MDELKPLLVLLTSGLLIRYALIFAGQNWAKTHAQTMGFLLLPIITYVITNTIKGNIALSLGMIGALSIVRFRHPVKSALELIIYFDLITIGIATSVRTKWSIQLTICTILIIIAAKYINDILKKKGSSFYSVSFNEGMSLNSIEVFSNKEIKFLEDNKNLINFMNDKNSNEYVYKLTFENKKDLIELKNKLNEVESIIRINSDLN
tara:strand:- start:2366 stop:2983 length:618 start_codon:yes stop_codon:yes gene_type:complete